MKVILYSFLIIFAFSHAVLAQFSSRLEVSSAYDDNVFRSPDPTEDFVSDLSLDLSYKFNNSNVQINYNGNFIFYRSLNERNLSLHRLSLNYFKSFGKDDLHSFFIGVNGLTRIDGEEYKEYDYKQLYAYANVRLDLESLFIKTGYNFRYRDYITFSELNNLRHYLFLQINKSFTTRTTMIMEADLGYKVFTTPVYFTSLEESIHDGGGSGPGSGMMTGSSFPVTISTSVPPMGQLTLLGRISQSVFEKMGVYVQYRKQINLSDQITSITGNSFYQDEELFDDPFSYEGEEISTQLTWIMPWSMRLQLGGSLFYKSYINDTAYTSFSDTLGSGGQRIDKQKNLFLNFTKSFMFNKKWLNTLQFNMYVGYSNNESNSIWYNYTNRLFGGGIQWRF
jgi:hypothetical protein